MRILRQLKMCHRKFEMEQVDSLETVAAVVADKVGAEALFGILIQTHFYECVFTMRIFHIFVFLRQRSEHSFMGRRGG